MAPKKSASKVRLKGHYSYTNKPSPASGMIII